MENKNYTIKLTGEADLPEALENGKDYLVSMECSVVSESKVNNEDGTYDTVFKVKPISVEVLKSTGGTIKSIDRKRMSQKFRSMVNYYRKENYSEIEEEDFYNSFMGKALANFMEIAEFLKKIK